MKLTLTQQTLQKALRVVQKSVSTKPQLPILSCILVKASDKTLSLFSTDLYTGVTVEIDAEVETPGEFAVPGKYFTQIISSLNSTTLTIEKKDGNVLILAKDSKTKLVEMDTSEFPEFPQIDPQKNHLPVEEFQQALSRVAFSASSDQTRPILTGVLCKFNKDEIQLIATDGFRLAITQLQAKSEIDQEMIIPAKALVDILKTAEEESVKTITFSVSEALKQVKFEVGAYTFYIRLLEGEYPPYQKIIPTQIATKVVCNRQDLEEKLQRSLIFNQDNSFITQFTIDKEGVTLFATSPSAGEYTTKLSDTEVKGSEVVIAFNSRYVLDFLKSFQDDFVTLEIVESLRPARFSIDSVKDFQYVVMPFRVTT